MVCPKKDYFLVSEQAKGLGYAMNTPEELKFVKEVAQTTGVVLDPVYRFDVIPLRQFLVMYY